MPLESAIHEDTESHFADNHEVSAESVSELKEEVGIDDTEPKRVKAYVLENNEWKDTGTGFCIGKVNIESKSDNAKLRCAYLVVNNEDSPDDVLLRSKLEGNIEYQRQEETLIVWKDLSGRDIALSFEESIGCDVLCEFIVEVQRNIESNISLVAVKSNDNGIGSVHEIITGPVSLPSKDPKQNEKTLMESLRILNENIAFEFLKNETIEFVLQSNYINLLIEHFKIAEAEKLPKDLFILGNIVKTLILYNQRDILEQMAEDDKVVGIVGILEYDTEFPTLKANHRKCLESYNPSFKEVIPIDNEDLKSIVKKCFRLQFLKDVVLVRFLDDHNFNSILDIILDLQTCIIDFLQVDPFLDKLIHLYDQADDGKSSDDFITEKRKDGIKLLHQCVQMSKNLDPIDISKFYKTLVRKKLFKVLDYAFHVETDSNLRIMATDTIITIIEHDILLIHNVQNESAHHHQAQPIIKSGSSSGSTLNHNQEDIVLENGNTTSTDMSLLLILSTILLTDKSPGLKEQVVQALHTLLHPEGCLGNGNEYENSPARAGNSSLEMISDVHYDLQADSDELDSDSNRADGSLDTGSDFQILEYFANFYKQVAPVLFEPLIKRATANKDKTQPICDDNLLTHLVKLVSFICTEHDRRMSREFILENGVLESVSELIDPSHSLQLRLTAVRCLKNIMCLDDDYYHRHMISKQLYAPIFVLLEENLNKDNLANSCIQDFFKIILVHCLATRESAGGEQAQMAYRRTNFTLLSKHLLQKYSDILQRASYIRFIKDMIQCNKDELLPDNNLGGKKMDGSNGNPHSTFDEERRTYKRLHSQVDSLADGEPVSSFGNGSVTFKNVIDKLSTVEPPSAILGELMRE